MILPVKKRMISDFYGKSGSISPALFLLFIQFWERNPSPIELGTSLNMQVIEALFRSVIFRLSFWSSSADNSYDRASESRGRHSDKFSCSVRPTAEPRSKILACPTESRAEPNCPIVRKSLGSALGSAPEHFFGQIRTVGQPNSRDYRSLFLGEI